MGKRKREAAVASAAAAAAPAGAKSKELRDAGAIAPCHVQILGTGYDTLESDPEAGKRSGGLCLETPAFRAIGEALARSCRRVLIVQEGGYDLAAIPGAAKALVEGLASSCS